MSLTRENSAWGTHPVPIFICNLCGQRRMVRRVGGWALPEWYTAGQPPKGWVAWEAWNGQRHACRGCLRAAGSVERAAEIADARIEAAKAESRRIGDARMAEHEARVAAMDAARKDTGR